MEELLFLAIDVCGVSDVMQTEIHTAKPLVPSLITFKV
jgi:hypothetical protein